MGQGHRTNSVSAAFVLAALLAFLVGGCATTIGTTRLNVAHYPLDKIENRKQGAILVTRFTDKRKERSPDLIGNRRNGFGTVLGHIGMEGDVRLDVLLTKCFADALNAAGYTTVIQNGRAAAPGPGRFDAIVTGDIEEFWMDLYMKVWHRVRVNTKALNLENRTVLWEKRIEAHEEEALRAGAKGEYEKTVDKVLTKALNQAAQEYASDEFFRAIKR